MGAALKFKHTDVPRQDEERARLKVVHGPDMGSVFVITSNQITIGRGDENDVVLADLKTSRRHAEILWDEEKWNVRDLESANGILHNGKNTRSSILKTSDVITLGDTTLEFVLAEMKTSFLKAVPRKLTEIKKEQSVFSERQEKIRALAQIGGQKTRSGIISGGAGKEKGVSPRTVVLLVGVGAAAYVLFGSTPQPLVKKAKAPQSLANYLPSTGSTDVAVNKTADVFFRQGFREYLDKNYIRAKLQFETALQISPGHQLAGLYLENCNREIAEEVKHELQSGKKDFDAGKLKEAKNHFESVQRLLYRSQNDPSFIEAQSQLKLVEETIAGVRTSQ